MLASPADQYMPMNIALMVAFVVVALAFILTGEVVRRRTRGKTPPDADTAREPAHRDVNRS